MKQLLMPFLFVLAACSNTKQQTPVYTPDDPELYKAIVAQDSIYFKAYNTCDMATQTRYYADTLEFYHDKGGLMTDKTALLESLRKNICGKVTRTLVPGSIEVYPIKDFGAIEMGQHQFYNNQEPDAKQHPSKFIIFWRYRDGSWQMTKVVSLH